MINYELEEQLKPFLITGEKLLWTGTPKKGILLKPSDWFMIPFSIFFLGFSLVWELSVWVVDASPVFKIAGIPFILVGVYILIGRFFTDARKRATTIFGLTPDRVMIKTSLFSKSVQSLHIKKLSGVTIVMHAPKNGGTFRFEKPYLNKQDPPTSINNTPALEFIDDAQEVYSKIISLQK